MNRTLKTLLVWLLVALLPLHAVAGSLGMSCAPVHHQSGPASAASVASPDASVADAHAHHDAGHVVAAVTDGDTPADTIEKSSHSSCSACSAFCLGAAAPPSAFLPVPAFDGSDAVAVPPALFAVGFIQDGPQRPPRQ